MTTSGGAVSLACDVEAIPREERGEHEARMRRLFHGGRPRREIGDGYEYRFDAAELPELARFIALERRCCPFLRFELEMAPPDHSPTLRLTGPEGTRAFLDAELFH